ncbi:MAG: MBL fold metallo-hydrolase [Phycisphaerae bacterium]|nr:MBL fold metallo-hydrolase [Phycisphaerae bacterium]
MESRVISIGTLACNPLWGERVPVRTGHATTTLVRSGGATIVVDPALPGPALAARLGERAGLTPSKVTHVFLTSFHPECRGGLGLFEHAEWLIHEPEREAIGTRLALQLRNLVRVQGEEEDGDDPEGVGMSLRERLERDVSLLQRCQPAPDRPADRVSLFPLPGVSPGMCGLLLEGPRATTLIAGDAVATAQHLDSGLIVDYAMDVPAAKESFQEAIEIADVLIPGRDNVVLNPIRRPY